MAKKNKKSKKYKVGFKTINAKLRVTKHHLTKIKEHVSAKDQKQIAAIIEAINVIIPVCGKSIPMMSKTYIGK
jgi:hypothetical protein